MSSEAEQVPVESALRDEVFALASSVCDGNGTADEIERLNKLLATSHLARDIYREAVGLHVGLQYRHETAVTDTPGGSPAVDSIMAVPAASHSGWWGRLADPLSSRPGASLGLALLIAAVVGSFFLLRERPSEDGNNTVIDTVAILHLEEPCEWSLGDSDLQDGTRICEGRRIELRQGLATLSYESGAILTVEAPAVLHLLSRSSVRIESGRVFARVPKPAAGFTVITPTARIIDLGTEFGVHVVDSLHTNVGVLEGSAECFALDNGGVPLDRTQLMAGEALTVEHSGIKPLADFDPVIRGADPTSSQVNSYWRFEEDVPPPSGNGGTQQGVIGDSSGHGRSLDYWSGDSEGIGPYRGSDDVPPTQMFRHPFSGGSRSFDCGSLNPERAGVLTSTHFHGTHERLGRGFTLEGFFKSQGDMSAAKPMMLVFQGEKYFSYEVMLNNSASGSCTCAIYGSVVGELLELQVALEGKNFADGMWHYFVARYNPPSNGEPGLLQFTVVDEGLQAYTSTVTVPAHFSIASSDRPLLLGRYQYFLNEPSKAHFVGLLDEIRIADSPLGDEELIGVVPRSP